MQRDKRHPHKFAEVVERGVVRFVRAEYGGSPADVLSALLVPGDLVRDGRRYRSYRKHFFGPLAPLARHVPLYPSIGNHEEDSAWYFRYFRLPTRGDEASPEHWWWQDIGNVRVVGLDSNVGYRNQAQLAWLERLLARTCDEPHVDFVFAQLHHPERSELWPDGDTAYAGLVARRLERFASRCGKPTLQLHGHTHGYERVHSRERRHSVVGVASAGGELDHVQPGKSASLPGGVVLQAEYGFVVIEVAGGARPWFRVRRVSLGNEREARDNEVRDTFTVHRDHRAKRRHQPESEHVLP
jgi:hypothetical protein